jgi:hypothetical protein
LGSKEETPNEKLFSVSQLYRTWWESLSLLIFTRNTGIYKVKSGNQQFCAQIWKNNEVDVSVTVQRTPHTMLRINSIQIKPEINVKKDVEGLESIIF